MSYNNDLISRSALLSKRRTIKPPECNSCEYEHMEYVRAEDVQNAPVVDAVEVVRCKDCIHTTRSKANPEKIICCLTLMCGTTKPDFFCAHGERKMDAEVEG